MRQVVLALVLLFFAACASTGAPPRPAVMQSAYLRYIAAPTMRAARSNWCEAIRGKSIPVNRSSEESTEQSEWAGMDLLTEQKDCRYMDAFYAELDYAARHHVLGEGWWQSCLRIAPVHQLNTALDLAIYMQCLRVVQSAEVCQAARMDANRYSVPGAGSACAQLLRANDWSQGGLNGIAGRSPVSLFGGGHPPPAAALPRRDEQVLQLPTQITLTGEIRTGFFFNCCLFGMGYNMPYSHLHLPQAVTVSDDLLRTIPVRDIELDQDVAGPLVDKPVKVSCESLRSGETAHYALRVYCDGAQIGSSTAPQGLRWPSSKRLLANDG